MTGSKLEINIKRLLKNTETLSRDAPASFNWKLEKYVKALSDMLSELELMKRKPDSETLNEYRRRINFLKNLVESQKIENPVKRVVALQMMSHGVSTTDGNISREIQQKTASKYNSEIRKELFQTSSEPANEIRQRKLTKTTGEDSDAVLEYHQVTQEKVISDMLHFTRDLKEQSQIAQNLLLKDTEKLKNSTEIADGNLSRLKEEAAILESHNKRAWRIWMWKIIIIVMIIFLFMVGFIRMTKKNI